MSQSNGSAGDPKETSDGTVMPPAAEEGDSENKMQLSELLKRHSSQEPESMTRYDTLYKLLVVGDSGVGKTSLIRRFVSGDFSAEFLTTIVIDFQMKVVQLGGKKAKLQIWDASGQEKYIHLCENFFRAANGAVFVYDVNKRQSFQNLKKWIKRVKDHAKAVPNLQTVIVANKTDQDPGLREVTREEGHVFAIENGSRYYETSAKDPERAEDVGEVFQSLATAVSAAFEAAERMESDAAAVRFRERAALPASASAASTPQGRASMIVRGMTRRGGSLRRSLKRLTIGGGGRKSDGGPPSTKERVSIGKDGEEEWGNAAEILAEVRRNSEGDKGKSTWSKRYSTLRRSLGRRKKASKSAEPPPPPPPDDAVTPGTCCAFSRRR